MLTMPALDQAVIADRARIAAELSALLAPDAVIAAPAALKAYETDALTAYRQLPLIAVLPSTVDEVARVLRYCLQRGIKVVPRGAGTSLSGGALPLGDGVLLGLGKFNRILDIDLENRCAVVQPGVTNLAISHAVAGHGFYYAPDPSSQIACTIGGNVAENSGGVHCLKYGLTTNNLLGLQVVLIDGEVVRVGGKHLDAAGYDLMGILTGSEGLLGVVTEVTVRLLRRPPREPVALAPDAFVDELNRRLHADPAFCGDTAFVVETDAAGRIVATTWQGPEAMKPVIARIVKGVIGEFECGQPFVVDR